MTKRDISINATPEQLEYTGHQLLAVLLKVLHVYLKVHTHTYVCGYKTHTGWSIGQLNQRAHFAIHIHN